MKMSSFTFISMRRSQGGKPLTCRMTIKASLEPFLIQVMSDEADTSAKHEQSIESANAHVFVGFLSAEGAR
jgi:hypothetical protein